MGDNILYVTWGETIVDFGIFKNQVLEQLKLIKQERPDLNLFLLSAVPIGNKKLFKNPDSFIIELKRIRAVCKENGIRFSWHWIPVLSPWFYTPRNKLRLYDLFQKKFVKKFILENEIQIAHCRSYTPTRIFLETREKNPDFSFKIIFDTRGNYPEEGRIKGLLTEADYKFWKEKEKELFRASDAIVNVSDTFTDYVKTITDNPHIYTIYTSTNLSIFKRLKNEERSFLRKKNNIGNDEKVLVYLGDIGEGGWHDKMNLFKLYYSFKDTFENTKLLLITRCQRAEIEESFVATGGNKNELLVIKGGSPKEVNQLFNLGDYGSLPFKKIKNPLDKILGYTMIASKTGEYLACGLPVLTNKDIGDASKLVVEEEVGIVYQMENEKSIQEQLLKLESNKKAITEKCIKVSGKFNAKRNAELYLNVYERLLNNKSTGLEKIS